MPANLLPSPPNIRTSNHTVPRAERQLDRASYALLVAARFVMAARSIYTLPTGRTHALTTLLQRRSLCIMALRQKPHVEQPFDGLRTGLSRLLGRLPTCHFYPNAHNGARRLFC